MSVREKYVGSDINTCLEKILEELNKIHEQGIIEIEFNDNNIVNNIQEIQVGYRQLVQGVFKRGILHLEMELNESTKISLLVFHTCANDNKLVFPLNYKYVKKNIKHCFRKWFENALNDDRRRNFKAYLKSKTTDVSDSSSESSQDNDSSSQDSDSSSESSQDNDSSESSDSDESDEEIKANEKAKSKYIGADALNLYERFMTEINTMLQNKIISVLDDEAYNDKITTKQNFRSRILKYERNIYDLNHEGKLTLKLISNRELSINHYDGSTVGFPFHHAYVKKRPFECFQKWLKYVFSEPDRNKMTRFKQWCEEKDRYWTLKAASARSNAGVSMINRLPGHLLTEIFRQSLRH